MIKLFRVGSGFWCAFVLIVVLLGLPIAVTASVEEAVLPVVVSGVSSMI